MRALQPRLLLLPLLFVALLAPALLTTSAQPDADHDVQVGTVCKNGDAPVHKTEAPHGAPNCVNCRAPLLNAPLAQVDRDASLRTSVALPPSA